MLQSKGVCPAQTWFSLALDALKGVCTSLEEAGYQIFDEETLAAFNRMYGPPIAREATTPLPTPPSQTTPSFSPQSPQRPVSQQSPTFQSQTPSQSPVSSLSPQTSSLQPQGPGILGSTQGRQDFSSQGFAGQPGSVTPGIRISGQPDTDQRFAGQPGTVTSDQSFTGTPGSPTAGPSFVGSPGSSTDGQSFTGSSGFTSGQGGSTAGQSFAAQLGFSGRPGSSTASHSFAGQGGTASPTQSFAGHSGTSTAGQGFTGTFSPGHVGVSSTGQSFSGKPGRIPGQSALTPTRQPFSGHTTVSSTNQIGGFTTTQKFSGQTVVSSPGHQGVFATGTGFTGQRETSTAGQPGFSNRGQVFSGHQGVSSTGQVSGHQGMSNNGRRFSSSVTVGQHMARANTTYKPHMPQASSFLSPRLPQMPTVHGRTHMGHSTGGLAHQGFNQGGYFFSQEMMSFERFGAQHTHMMHHPSMARGRSFTASSPTQSNVGTPSRSRSHQTATKSKPEADLEVREGHLLTAVTGLSNVGQAGTQDLSYLHKPRDHQLHSFYNG